MSRLLAAAAFSGMVLGGLLFVHQYKQRANESPTVVKSDFGRKVDLRDLLNMRRSIQSKPLEKEMVARVQAVLRKAGPNEAIPSAAALELRDLLDSDAQDCSGWVADVDGDGQLDLVLKRYWTGSGARFELLVCINRAEPAFYSFSGGERGTTYYAAGGHIPIEQHLLNSGDGKIAIVVPDCLMDRGADSVLNWPTIYAIRDDRFVVADREFISFYEGMLLPRYRTERHSAEAGAVRELVRGLSRP